MKISYLDITGEGNKFYNINGITYLFKTKWNKIGSFFTIEVYNKQGNQVFSNKIVYGLNMVDFICDITPFSITPLSVRILSGEFATQELMTITQDNLGGDIKLITELIQ